MRIRKITAGITVAAVLVTGTATANAATPTTPTASIAITGPSQLRQDVDHIIQWEQASLRHVQRESLVVTDGAHSLTIVKATGAGTFTVSQAGDFAAAGGRQNSVPASRGNQPASTTIRVTPACWFCISFAWHVAKCAAILGANAFIAYKLIRGLRAGLSIYEFAKLLVQGTFARKKLLAIAGGITGISSIIDACL